MSLIKTAISAWKRKLMQGAIKDTAAFEKKLVDANVWNYDKEARGLLKGSLGRTRKVLGIPNEKVKLNPKEYAESWKAPDGLLHDKRMAEQLRQIVKRTNTDNYAATATTLQFGNRGADNLTFVTPGLELGNGKKSVLADLKYNKRLDPNNKSHVLGTHAMFTSHEAHELGALFGNKNHQIKKYYRTKREFDASAAMRRKQYNLASHGNPEVLYRESNDLLFMHPEVRKAFTTMRMKGNNLKYTMHTGRGPGSNANFIRHLGLKPTTFLGSVSEGQVIERLAPGFEYGKTYISPKQMNKAFNDYVETGAKIPQANPYVEYARDAAPLVGGLASVAAVSRAVRNYRVNKAQKRILNKLRNVAYGVGATMGTAGTMYSINNENKRTTR